MDVIMIMIIFIVFFFFVAFRFSYLDICLTGTLSRSVADRKSELK